MNQKLALRRINRRGARAPIGRCMLYAVLGSPLLLGGCESDAPADPQLRVNEVVPSNQSGGGDVDVDAVAGTEEHDDWIEIYNPTVEDVSLEGFGVSDHADDLRRVVLGGELGVESGGVLVLWADGQTEQGPNHLPFRLNATEGEGVYLSGPSGELLDSVAWEAAAPNNHSFARFPDGDGEFIWCVTPSFDALNGQSPSPACVP